MSFPRLTKVLSDAMGTMVPGYDVHECPPDILVSSIPPVVADSLEEVLERCEECGVASATSYRHHYPERGGWHHAYRPLVSLP